MSRQYPLDMHSKQDSSKDMQRYLKHAVQALGGCGHIGILILDSLFYFWSWDSQQLIQHHFSIQTAKQVAKVGFFCLETFWEDKRRACVGKPKHMAALITIYGCKYL